MSLFSPTAVSSSVPCLSNVSFLFVLFVVSPASVRRQPSTCAGVSHTHTYTHCVFCVTCVNAFVVLSLSDSQCVRLCTVASVSVLVFACKCACKRVSACVIVPSFASASVFAPMRCVASVRAICARVLCRHRDLGPRAHYTALAHTLSERRLMLSSAWFKMQNVSGLWAPP